MAAVRGISSTTTSRRGCLYEASRPAHTRPQIVHRREAGPIGRRHHDGADHLTPSESGRPTTATSSDEGVTGQDRLDLGGHDRLTAGADDVAEATHDRDVALVVHVSQISRGVPAVDQRSARWRSEVVEVAVEEQWALHQ